MAKKPQKPAPAGKWELPDKEVLAALGAFVIGWSGLETVVEAGIYKQTGLPPLESSIITGGLAFKSRSSILSSLLHRNPEGNAQAIAILKQIQNISDRNDILHGVTGGNKNQVWFNRRRTDVKFSSKFEHYNRERLYLLALKCGDLATQLLAELDISPDEYVRFLQESHNAANKL